MQPSDSQDEELFREAKRRCGSNATLEQIMEIMKQLKDEREASSKEKQP